MILNCCARAVANMIHQRRVSFVNGIRKVYLSMYGEKEIFTAYEINIVICESSEENE